MGNPAGEDELDTAIATSAPAELPATFSAAPTLEPIQLAAGERIADRYLVEQLLGRGGFGEVYSVLDETSSGRRVALKLQRLWGVEDVVLDSLRAEFALLASLHHPHLARVYDFGWVGNQVAFFTQDLVRGVTLDRLQMDLRSRRAVELLAQLGRALAYLHSHGVLHRDIKPSNVLVDESRDHLVLLDFGIARAFDALEGPRMAGTSGYLAPEAFLGGTLDGRTDLYALGATLYRLAVGRKPFVGSMSEIMRQQVTGPEPQVPPGVLPPELAGIVERLLRREPADRYASAVEFLAALSAATGIALPAETDETLASYVLSAPAVGTEAEQARLLELTGPDHLGAVALVVGEAGTGKSRLLSEVRRKVQLDRRQWISVSAGRINDGRGLLARLARATVTPAVARALTNDDRIELSRALPELRRPNEQVAVPLDPDQARQARFEALVRALTLRFAGQASVVAVEDIHFADVTTIDHLVAFIGTATRLNSPCSFVLTTRPGTSYDRVTSAVDLEIVSTVAMSPEQSSALVRATFGSSDLIAHTELGTALRTRSTSALEVRETLRLALESGAIVRSGGQWQVTAPIPALELGAVLRERIRRLPRLAGDVGLAAAVLGQPATLIDLGAAAGCDVPRLAEPIGLLIRSGLLEDLRDGQGRTLYAMHDRILDALLAGAGVEETVVTHRRAAAQLEGIASRDWRSLARAAEHRAHAADLPRALANLDRGVALATQAGRPDAALELVDRQIELLRRSGDAPTLEMLFARVDLASAAGLGERSAIALTELRARKSGLGPDVRARVVLLEAAQSFAEGRAEDARRQCAESRHLAAATGDIALRSQLLEAEIDARHGNLAAALRGFEVAAARAVELGDHRLEARAWLGACHCGMFQTEPNATAAYARRAVQAAELAEDPVLVSESVRSLGNAYRELGDELESVRTHESAVAAARACGSIVNEAKALNNVGLGSVRVGRIEVALSAYQRALKLKERMGAAASADITRNNLAFLLSGIGSVKEARQLLEAVIARESTHAILAVAWGNLGELDARDGQLDTAAQHFERACEMARTRHLAQVGSFALSGLVRVLLMRNEGDDRQRARALLDEFRTDTEGLRFEAVRLYTTEALVADACGAATEAEHLARRAVEDRSAGAYWFGTFGGRIEAQWVHAVTLARLGRRAEADQSASLARLSLTWLAAGLGSPRARRRLLVAHPLHVAILRRTFLVPPGWSWRPSAPG